MSIELNGSTGYLEMAAPVITTYPHSFAIWVAANTGVQNQVAVAQSHSTTTRASAGRFTAFGDNKRATIDIVGNSGAATKTTTPHLSAATMQLLIAVQTSTSERHVFFGSSTPGDETGWTVADELSNHDRFTVGALNYNSAGPALFLDGDVAEVHVFNVALTGTEYTSMAGGTLPETITGWVDGWALEDYEAGGSYVSLGGTRTLTANGGVAASALAHPIDTSGRAAGGGIIPLLMQLFRFWRN